MPQERGLYRDMRVLDLLVWIARLHGLERADGRRRACALLEQLDLADRERDKISTLSGGMAQRVQLAAAMVHGPDLLVLDEPFAGLDPVAVRFLSDVITAHTRAGGNLLFSSHQLDLVEDLCETITLLHHGRVVLHGDLRTLKAESPNRWLRVDVGRRPVVDRPDDVGDRVGRRQRHAAAPRAPRRSRRGPRRHPSPRAGSTTSGSRHRACPSCSSKRPARRPRLTWLQATRLVAGRELREAFRRKSLWIVFAILFVGSSVAMILPDVLDERDARRYDVARHRERPARRVDRLRARDLRSRGRAPRRARSRSAPSTDRARARALVDDGDVDLAVVGDDSRHVVIVRTGENDTLVALVRQALASQLARTSSSSSRDSTRRPSTSVLTAPERADRGGRGRRLRPAGVGGDPLARALPRAPAAHDPGGERRRDREGQPHQRGAARGGEADVAVLRQGRRASGWSGWRASPPVRSRSW